VGRPSAVVAAALELAGAAAGLAAAHAQGALTVPSLENQASMVVSTGPYSQMMAGALQWRPAPRCPAGCPAARGWIAEFVDLDAVEVAEAEVAICTVVSQASAWRAGPPGA
jgi:hypothetical protein